MIIRIIKTQKVCFAFRSTNQVFSLTLGFRAKRAHVAFWVDFHFLQDRTTFWQTDLLWHEKQGSRLKTNWSHMRLDFWLRLKNHVWSHHCALKAN